MFKNVSQILVIVAITAAGFGYALMSDPERESHDLFQRAIVGFSLVASDLDQQYLTTKSFKNGSRSYQVDYKDENGQVATQTISMMIDAQIIKLTFDNAPSSLSEQSILLEPLVKDDTVYWRCINGSVLVRYRTKDCRLGYGFTIAQMKAKN